MKIFLKFKTQSMQIPIDYRRIFLSFLKMSLSQVADSKYYEKYYVEKQRRPFTFAVNLPKPKFAKESITLAKPELSVTFSTGDHLAGFVFFSAFLAQKNKPFKLPFGNVMELLSVTKLPEIPVSGNFALVKMLSPLCLRKHDEKLNKDIYYSVASKDFEINAKEILVQQLSEEGFAQELASNLSIIPVNCKKTVILHYGCYIECTIGDFIINADKSVINYFLQYGIGSRKSAGFGFAQLITEQK